MRPGAIGLAAALGLAAASPLQADEWTLIDVKARLANDGRVTVVETHDIVLATTGRNVFHDFGRGADQDVVLRALTRIGPDHEPHALRKVEAVTGPDEYAHYELGHAYLSIPSLGENVTVQYRFEYELVGAVAPSWAIAAGPGSRAPSDQELFFPWDRIGHVIDDWRRAWPALTTRYRFDHDVMLPDRAGQGHTLRQIDYRLEYGTSWRDTAPEIDIGAPVRGSYRVARIFDYLGPGDPVHATTRPAALRILSLLALPILGLLGFGLVVAVARARLGPPIDRTFVDTRFLARAPEEIAFRLGDERPAAADMLARLASEAAISIHVDRPVGHTFDDDDDGDPRLHLRRVAADAHLTAFERQVLDDLFGGDRELTTESHRRRHAGTDYDPDAAIWTHLQLASAATPRAAGPARPPGPARWSPARIGLGAVFAIGLFGVFRNVGPLFDVVPVVAIWAFFTIALVNGWSTGWWVPGRPVRGLLVPLILLWVMQLTVLFMPNRPLPAEGWAASAIAAVAAGFLILARAGKPGGDGVVTDLLRMRAYAEAELKRPRPQLDDRWIPRLRALGLGPAIEAWRARHAGAGAMPPEIGDRPSITSAHFTGRGPAPWSGPKGWHAALTVWDDRDEDDEAAHADDEDGRGHIDTDAGPGRTRS